MTKANGLRNNSVIRLILGGAALSFLTLSPLIFSANAKTPPAATLDSSYVSALAAADHLLQAWQSGDAESGMVLLTSHAKEAATSDGVEKFFSNSGPASYEIGRGKMLKRGRYEFPAVLVGGTSRAMRGRPRFRSIVVVNTGNNDWAVDKLP
ncbi:MAG: hypothetical protein WBX38_20185 [Candidatus Sulfotelmatobacter sp.]